MVFKNNQILQEVLFEKDDNTEDYIPIKCENELVQQQHYIYMILKIGNTKWWI